MNYANWPETDEPGTPWTCCSCGYGQELGQTNEDDPVACARCGGPTCIGCRTGIGYCKKCEEETRDEA